MFPRSEQGIGTAPPLYELRRSSPFHAQLMDSAVREVRIEFAGENRRR